MIWPAIPRLNFCTLHATAFIIGEEVKTLVVNNLILQRDILSRNLFLLFLVDEHREIQWMVLPAFKLMWKAFTKIVFALKLVLLQDTACELCHVEKQKQEMPDVIARAEMNTNHLERWPIYCALLPCKNVVVWFLQLNCFANQPAKQQSSTYLGTRRTHFNAVF